MVLNGNMLPLNSINFEMTKIKTSIVTGGAGFIGSHLVDLLLLKGHKVYVIDNMSNGNLKNLCLDHKNLNIVEEDISSKGKWTKLFNDADYVFHLAALADIVPSIEEPVEYFNANVLGSLNVIEASKFQQIRKFVYAASSSCYGIPQKYPTCEGAEIKPEYPYAWSKYSAESLIMHWSKVYNIPSVSLRLFNVYGPRSRTSGTYGAVFGVFLAQKLAGLPLTVVGDGEQTRDFTYVSDVAEAFYIASQSDVDNKIYNVGSGATISINRITQLLSSSVVHIPKRPGEPDCTYADISAIEKELSWRPKVSIEEGVEIMLQNINYWSDAPVWEPRTIEQATKSWFKYLG